MIVYFVFICSACVLICDSQFQVGDRTGQITAQMNISDLRALLGIEDDSHDT